MELNEYPKITLTVSNKSNDYKLLSDLYSIKLSCFNEIKDLNNKFDALKQIIEFIEVEPRINYSFLLELKEKKLEYYENEEKWDFQKNFYMLQKTLTTDEVKSLTGEDIINPIDELKNTFSEIISNKISEVNRYEFNFPVIYGIERLRLKFYETYLILKKNNYYKLFKDYVDIIDKDEDIRKYSPDDYGFCPKMYLFILTITEMIPDCEKLIYLKKYFIKNTLIEKEIPPIIKNGEINIGEYDDDNYFIQIKDKIHIINKKDYIIESLSDEIIKYNNCPFKILLMRNMAFKKYMKECGEEGFLAGLHLYDSFIKYIKEFLKSKAMKELFNNNQDFTNISALIQNDKYLDEILSTKHFKFLPFFQINQFYGFTNKEFLISVIDAKPIIVQGLPKLDETENEENLFYICLLFYITLIFITSLHEIVMHFTSGYLNFISEKKLSSDSPKDNNFNDGGYYFESKIIGGNKRFKVIKLKHIICLLDGRVCKKSLSEFQKDLKKKIEINNQFEEEKKEGLLGDFLKLYKIDFNIFKKKTTKLFVNCRNFSSIGIHLGSKVISSGWGHHTKK